ncbi:Colanic acid capsular biosynthesis activation accesory protein RcsA [Raoultella ornithinolytica]|nr:Colanic acid capsular biosynthesis activation accesory protein RcsA [Raoultella ornithinolytica]
MSTIIMDLCSYTRLGLSGYLTSRGIKKRDISEVTFCGMPERGL